MIFNFNGVKVFYSLHGEGQTATLLLHGWGCDSQIFSGLAQNLSGKILLLDFPPFGASNVQPKGWNIFTYANMVISLCEHCRLDKVNVIGHSFGGRVAILLCALRPDIFKRCVLIDSAGLKPKRRLGYYCKVYFYKFARSLGFYLPNFGSADYCALSSDMKEVFKKVVNEPLDQYLPLIKQNTLIIFGKNDKETPLYMAKRLHSNIKNSRLVIIEGAGHFCFLDKPLTCLRLVDEFLEE